MATERNGMDATSIDWSFAASQAHLPPRSPLFGSGAPGIPDNNSFFSSNWPKAPLPSTQGNRRHHQRTPSTSFLPQTPAWVDDLLNDSPDIPQPKNTHRRSSSDSFAFLEAPLQGIRITNIAENEELDSGIKCGRVLSTNSEADDKVTEQWVLPKTAGSGSTQANARTSSPENKTPFEASSALSDRDSANASSMVDDKGMKGVSRQSKNDTEVESALKTVHSPPLPGGKGESLSFADASLDPKRAKRILANRQSAQRSRVRKLQYIAELERTVNVLQEEVSALSPQVTYLDRHRILLNVDNSAMKQRIAALAQEKLFKDAHNDALKVEVHRLRQLYQQQQKLASSQQTSLACEGGQPQFNLHTSSQLEQLKDLDMGIDVTKCAEYVFKENNEADLLVDTHVPPAARSPLLNNKPIRPSSCSSSEKGKGSSCSLEQLHSDFRIQN